MTDACRHPLLSLSSALRPRVVSLAVALVVAAGSLWTPAAAEAQSAETTLTLGVFLPQGQFATNAERSAFAQELAARINTAANGAFHVEARAFARRSDVLSFTKAKRIDLLVADGLFLANRSETVIAYAANAVPATLFAPAGTTLASLKGKAVAIAQVGPQDANFFINTTLSGEVLADYFGTVRATKDAAAALGAVKTGAASAAFASEKHPAAKSLVAVAQGGTMTLAACAVVNPTTADAGVVKVVKEALLQGAGTGGGITQWRVGDGNLNTIRRMANRPPIAATTPAVLTTAESSLPNPPPIRLGLSTPLPTLVVRPELSVTPTLPEEPL